jgi:integrase
MNVFTARTERLNREVLRDFFAANTMPVDHVRPKHLTDYYRSLQARVAETTAQIHLRAIRAFFSWCVAIGKTPTNPATGLKFAKVERPARLRYCTASDRDTLIAAAPTDDLRFILYCGFHAGMRKNEIIEARVRWFDVREGGAIHICSTPTYRLHAGEEHFTPLTAEFREFLRGYLPTDPEAFALKPGVAHGRGTYRYDFHHPYNAFMLAQRKRWVTAHVMRHTFASILVQRGVSIYKVAKWLGDGVAVVEKHYAHLAAADEDIERML